MGGHYYAYIKSFEDGKWYNFNDSNVSVIPANDVNEEISKMFGGDSSTSAYMLQYRKYDKSKRSAVELDSLNQEKPTFFYDSISDSLIPSYQLKEIEKEKKDLITTQENKLKTLLRIQLKVHEPQSRDRYRMIVANKTDTMREFIEKIKAEACDTFCGVNYFNGINNKNIRLREYDTKLKVKQRVYEDGEEKADDGATVQTFDARKLIDYNFHSYFEFKLEVLAEEGGEAPEGAVSSWESYDPDWVHYRVWTWPDFLEARHK